MEDDFTSYEPSSFTVIVDNLEFDSKTGFVVQSDFAALIHEWWHYFQDISTITGQNGVYLWLRDMARISAITCSKIGQEIHIPLSPDEYGEPMSKYRKLYLYFCGKKKEFKIKDPAITQIQDKEVLSLNLDGDVMTLPACKILINGQKYDFRLIALQELNCYYAQKIAEGFVSDVSRVPAESLPEFPYKVGDLLFDYYQINCDDRVKFLISYLCLDSIQAPVVFLKVLEVFSNQHLRFDSDIELIEEQVMRVANSCSCPNDLIYGEWMKDFSNWMNDSSRLQLSKSIEWFVTKMCKCDVFRRSQGASMFVKAFCKGLVNLNELYKSFPVPVFKQKGTLMGSDMAGNDQTIDFENEHVNALVLRYHKRLVDLLCAKDCKEVNEKAQCDAFDNCPYRKIVGKDYDCKMAVWEVLQGERQAKCPYAIALQTMGLWQNQLVVDVNQ